MKKTSNQSFVKVEMIFILFGNGSNPCEEVRQKEMPLITLHIPPPNQSAIKPAIITKIMAKYHQTNPWFYSTFNRLVPIWRCLYLEKKNCTHRMRSSFVLDCQTDVCIPVR